MKHTRHCAVAGSFYPASPQQLHHTIHALLEKNKQIGPRPFALVLPHAGYQYSGSIAAQGYSVLSDYAQTIEQVFIFGPSHHVYFDGMAVPSVDYFETPLGIIKINTSLINTLKKHPDIIVSDNAHASEHSLEVQLPFLQHIIGNFSLLPIVVGNCSPDKVSSVIDQLASIPKSLFVFSSDLSHFHSYQEAQFLDRETTNAIEKLDYHLNGHQACGCKPLNGLLLYCKKNHLKLKTLNVKNSGDTGGPLGRVVGYGAYIAY